VLHPSDGTLRRFRDEPRAVSDAVANHLDACGRCRARLAALGAAASEAETALSPTGELPVDPRGALAVVRARTFGETGRPRQRGLTAWVQANRQVAVPLGALAAAALLILLVAVTPLGTLAQNFLAIFEPRQFVAIPVTRGDLEQLRALPELGAYGTMREGTRPSTASVSTPRAAAFLAGMPVRVPTFIPPGVPRIAQYGVMGRTSAAFTFSAARAAAAAAASGKPLPPMPPRLDGSSLIASIGPVVVASYGISSDPRTLRRRAMHYRRRMDLEDRVAAGPMMVVVAAAVPHVSSTGASVREIESYLLQQPGVPPKLAAEIAAIGDPATTLPIPIPIEREVAQRVIVEGVAGLGILDNTGIGSGVLWQRNGIIYAVAGTLRARDILAVANSLR
jgi:anti-sigma factor RsiW